MTQIKMGCDCTDTNEILPEDNQKVYHQDHQNYQYVHNSFYNTKYIDNIRIDLSKQYRKGYDSDLETSSK